jgi:FSR family fosmidomycin resistance protein-like MFS transporter
MKNKYFTLAFLTLAHAIVDGTCAYLIIFGSKNNLISTAIFFSLVFGYDLLAFGLQAPLGLILDKIQKPRLAVVVSFIMLFVAVLIFSHFTVIAIIIIGLANAIFHLGGGTVSLNITKGKASFPGIFVSLGALGLTLGTLLGKSGVSAQTILLIVLAIFAFLSAIIYFPEIDYNSETEIKQKSSIGLILILILFAIAVRSLIGSVVAFPWKTDLHLLILLTLGVVLGKAVGGFLADRFGWIKFSAVVLIISAPLLAFGAKIPTLAILGIMLFQAVMPVTLVAIHRIFPSRPAFSFGLTCLALFFGLLPTYSPLKVIFQNHFIILTMILLTAIILTIGLASLLLPENAIIKKITKLCEFNL